MQNDNKHVLRLRSFWRMPSQFCFVNHSYQVGDMVWMLNENRKVGKSPKLQPAFLCPYVVSAKYGKLNFEIQLDGTGTGKSRVVHHDKLKKYAVIHPSKKVNWRQNSYSRAINWYKQMLWTRSRQIGIGTVSLFLQRYEDSDFIRRGIAYRCTHKNCQYAVPCAQGAQNNPWSVVHMHAVPLQGHYHGSTRESRDELSHSR